MKTTVSLVKCTSYEYKEIERSARRAVDLIGGIGRHVKRGERILLKVNLLSARTPERAVTTHPEVARAMIRLVREAGGIPVLGDSPGGAIKGLERVWTETGMKALAAEEKTELVSFETAGAVEKAIDHHSIKSVHVSKFTLDVDGIINLPKLKTHGLQTFTGAVKNMYGTIPGIRKAEYHKLAPHPDDFGRLLGEIYLIHKNKLRFTLIDGVEGMEGNGPSSGEIRKLDMILASADGLALDTAIVHMLGFDPGKIETIKYLKHKNAGASSMADIEVAGDGPENFNLSNFKFPPTWYISLVPHFFINFVGKFIWLKPKITPETCTACQLCVNSCPVKAIAKSGKGGKPEVIRERCISCLCCHELCPFDAIELERSFLAKRMFRG